MSSSSQMLAATSMVPTNIEIIRPKALDLHAASRTMFATQTRSKQDKVGEKAASSRGSPNQKKQSASPKRAWESKDNLFPCQNVVSAPSYYLDTQVAGAHASPFDNKKRLTATHSPRQDII